MVRVKICGITSKENAFGAVDAGADALGFIFYSKSPRFITPEQATAIIDALPPFVEIVGVFVNESLITIDLIVRQCRLSLIQLHGDETPDYCERVQHRIIKAFRMTDTFNYNVLRNYKVSAYLLDTAVQGHYGGTGKSFEWSKALPAKEFGPVILAGGLTVENLADAITAVHPYAIDVSSGVEFAPGKKDIKKIEEVVKICRRFNC